MSFLKCYVRELPQRYLYLRKLKADLYLGAADFVELLTPYTWVFVNLMPCDLTVSN